MPRHVAEHNRDATVLVRDEVVVVTTDGVARGVVTRQVHARDYWRDGGQDTLLDHGRLFVLLLDQRKALVLDADRGDVGQNRQQVQIIGAELPDP